MEDANVNGFAPGSIPADTEVITDDAVGEPGNVFENQNLIWDLPELLDALTDIVIEFPHVPVITTARVGSDIILTQPPPRNVDRVNLTHDHELDSVMTLDSYKTAEDLTPIVTVVPAASGK